MDLLDFDGLGRRARGRCERPVSRRSRTTIHTGCALRPRIQGQALGEVRILHPFVLRTVEPSPHDARARRVVSLSRLGKRIVIGLEGELFLVLHLMIAGRLRWGKPGPSPPRPIGLAALDFPGGTLLLTEAGTKKRASLHIVRGSDALAAHDP